MVNIPSIWVGTDYFIYLATHTAVMNSGLQLIWNIDTERIVHTVLRTNHYTKGTLQALLFALEFT